MVKRRAVFIAVLCWVSFGWLIHALAPTLNGLRWGALPMGFWLASQGAALILAIAACWLIPQARASKDER